MARPPEATEGGQGTERADSALSPSSPLCSMSWAIGAALGAFPFLSLPTVQSLGGVSGRNGMLGVRGKAWPLLALRKASGTS